MPSLPIEGMHCEHCKKSIKETVEAIIGVKNVQVCLDKNMLSWESEHDEDLSDEVKKAVSSIGFIV